MRDARHLELLEDSRLEDEMVEGLIKAAASDGKPIHILEAGCGRKWPFELEGIEYVLTGVDLDKDALAIRKNTLADLHETIEGDLCTVDLGADSYDVIYSSFVLEHIERADLVMKNFAKWAKPNGIIIIKIPDPHSVQGYVTRKTPHWFHVFYYRNFLGHKMAGTPGYGPYPTYYNPIVSRSGIRSFCDDTVNGMVLEAEYGDKYFKPGHGTKKVLINLLKKFINIVSVGRLSDSHTNVLYVLRKVRSQ